MDRIQENAMKTFELEEFYFHYINEFGISVLCMTDKKFEKKLAFAFLQDVKKSLLEFYTQREL
jgi:calcineurin-like phosphoesterase